MHDFLKLKFNFLISVFSYMFRTSCVNHQGDSCMCSVVCFTRISVGCKTHRNCK
jgi:hypothetical protein